MISWIDSKDQMPSQNEDLIIAKTHNGLVEIIYIENGEIKKPWRYDKDDTPSINCISDIAFWETIN